MSEIKLSVIIPMFNEAENAIDTIRRVEQTLNALGEPFEIIPVNDGSTDETLQILDQIAETNPNVRVVSYWKNGGRGKALRYGFKAARGHYISSVDADLSYDPEYILKMAKVLDQEDDIDVVLASPYMPGGRTEGVPLNRLLISKLGNQIINLSMPENIYTITCVVRCYRREVLESLDLESNDKEIHLEILSKVLAMGFKVKEIPAVLTARQRGRSKFRFRSTASSHLVFTMFQRPALLFGIVGILLTLIGLGIGLYLSGLYMDGSLSPDRPLINLMTLFILGGIQILSFGFLASQINFLRKEILKVRRAISTYSAPNPASQSRDTAEP